MPTPAVLVQVADAVTTAINANQANFVVPTLQAVRNYDDIRVELKTASELRVDVIPAGLPESDLTARRKLGYAAEIHVAVRKRFKQSEQDEDTGRVHRDEIDTMELLIEQIHELLAGNEKRELATSINWRDAAIIHFREHLAEYQQFTAAVRLTYNVAKSEA